MVRVTRLNKRLGCGFILNEEGCEAYFDLSSLKRIDIRSPIPFASTESRLFRRHVKEWLTICRDERACYTIRE
jgi:hypothetical protein